MGDKISTRNYVFDIVREISPIRACTFNQIHRVIELTVCIRLRGTAARVTDYCEPLAAVVHGHIKIGGDAQFSVCRHLLGMPTPLLT